MAAVNKEYKDRLFNYLFGTEENKAWTLSLYNTINDSHFTDVNAISITTMKEVLYLGMHNDVSFLISDVMNLYEQQSTYNPNVPLRELQYAGNLYEKYIADNDLNKYGTRLLKLPAPKLVTFYNGSKDQPDEKILLLSDSFPENSDFDIEVRVRMININYGKSKKLLARCTPLREYSWFIREIQENNKSFTLDKAINRALDSMPDNYEIKKFLKMHRAEVVGLLLTEYDEAKAMELFKKDGREEGREEGYAEGREEGHEEGYAEGREEGREEGYAEGSLNMLFSLARDQVITVQEGASRSGMSVEEFRKLMIL